MPDSPDGPRWPLPRMRWGPPSSGYAGHMSRVSEARQRSTRRDPQPPLVDGLAAGAVPDVHLGRVGCCVHPPRRRSLDPLDALLVPLTTLPIALRRYRPLAVLAVTVGAQTLLLLFSSRVQVPLGVIVALYTVASRCERPVSIRAASWVALPITVGVIVNSGLSTGRIIPKLALFAIAWVVGDNVRTRRAYLAELEARAARLEREREERAERAVIEERTRIARELHDVIAHNVSVMVVQASAGEDVFDTDPARARESLSAVASTGRAALTELRRLLGVIRADEDHAGYAPQPGIEYLDELVGQIRETGLAVELSVLGEPRELPEGVGLCAYRIVQEALTNTLKHADASEAQVSVRYVADALELQVTDDGRAAPLVNGDTTGHGLIGMRERVALFGGELWVGARAGRGFEVSARLPLEEPRHVSVRVLICDDQALVRGGFRAILDARPEIEVVGEAENGAQAVALAERRHPDVILMDIRMPVLDGIEATRKLVADGSQARVIVLTTFDLDEYVHAAIRAGASGFLLKDVTPAKLVEAIGIVAQGDALLAPSVTRRLLERFAATLPVGDQSSDALAELTAREIEVLRLLAGGLSNAEIAAELVVSEATVKTHISSVLRKLGLRDRVQAVIVAYQTGLVRLGNAQPQ